jgi:hypothetical protein
LARLGGGGLLLAQFASAGGRCPGGFQVLFGCSQVLGDGVGRFHG